MSRNAAELCNWPFDWSASTLVRPQTDPAGVLMLLLVTAETTSSIPIRR